MILLSYFGAAMFEETLYVQNYFEIGRQKCERTHDRDEFFARFHNLEVFSFRKIRLSRWPAKPSKIRLFIEIQYGTKDLPDFAGFS